MKLLVESKTFDEEEVGIDRVKYDKETKLKQARWTLSFGDIFGGGTRDFFDEFEASLQEQEEEFEAALETN